MSTSRAEELLKRAVSDHGVKVIDVAALIASTKSNAHHPASSSASLSQPKPKSTTQLIRDTLLIPAGAIIPVVFPAALKACLAASGDYDANHTPYVIKDNMTDGEKALGVIFASGTIFSTSFILAHSAQQALSAFKNQWRTLRMHCVAPVSKAAYTIVSISVAFAFSGTTFQFAEVLSENKIFSGVFALFEFPTVFVATNVALNKIHARLLNACTLDSDTKFVFATLLERINVKYRSKVERLFNEVKLVADSLDDRAEQFALRLTGLVNTHSDLFLPAQMLEVMTKKSIIAFNVASVFAFAIPAFMVMTQKGFDSANIAGNLFNEQNTKNDFFWLKLMEGLLAGLGATLIFANSGIEARHEASNLFNHLKTHKRQIPRALLVLASAGLASTAMYRTARESLATGNIFEIQDDSIVANIMAVLFTLAASLIYFSLILKVPAKAFANLFAPLHPSENETTIAFFIKQLRSSDQIVSRETAAAIRELTDLSNASLGDDIDNYFDDDNDVPLERVVLKK